MKKESIFNNTDNTRETFLWDTALFVLIILSILAY